MEKENRKACKSFRKAGIKRGPLRAPLATHKTGDADNISSLRKERKMMKSQRGFVKPFEGFSYRVRGSPN
jgi:hypothetical protein